MTKEIKVCPICGDDRQKDIEYLDALMPEHRLIHKRSNPGGKELLFEGKGRLQIHDMCNACDEKIILDFLGKSDNKL